jgi:hypothetical protein
MIVVRKKTNIQSNIILVWNKTGLILFNLNYVFQEFSNKKKYIFEDLFISIKSQFEFPELEIRFLNRLIIS